MIEVMSQGELQARYAELLGQYDPMPENGFPDFEGMKAFVKAELQDEDGAWWHQALSEFANFEAFYNWLDTLTAYDAMDAGDSVFDAKPLLEVVYHALLSEKPEDATVAAGAQETQEAQDNDSLPKIVGYQVHTPDGKYHWGDRPSYLILTEATAIRDLLDARKGQGHWIMTAILEDDIQEAWFEDQGWDLFGREEDVMEIQRDDEYMIFKSDDEAIAFVRRMAQTGSQRHIDAITRHDADEAKRNWPFGVTFINLKDETDTDEHGKERITPKGSSWVVTGASGAGDNWLLSCEATGAGIIPSSFDLRNDFTESE